MLTQNRISLITPDRLREGLVDGAGNSIESEPLAKLTTPPMMVDDDFFYLDAIDEGGYVPIPNGPGLGVEIDEEALRANEYTHWERPSPTRPDGSTGYI